MPNLTTLQIDDFEKITPVEDGAEAVFIGHEGWLRSGIVLPFREDF
ncbi:MAG: hypothetical protein AAFN44_17460 [Pseudomonadota bacterium]